MIRRFTLAVACAAAVAGGLLSDTSVAQERASTRAARAARNAAQNRYSQAQAAQARQAQFRQAQARQAQAAARRPIQQAPVQAPAGQIQRTSFNHVAMMQAGPAPAQAYGQSWGTPYARQNWQRFYHYPYIYYPQNFWGNNYFRSHNDLYHRYPPEMRVPVYNKAWHNYYPEGRRYHYGHHFMLDVF